MARLTTSRWSRFGLSAAIFAAGAALFIARPGIALAHHVTVTESASCSGWDSKAEYIGGPDDRKIVVNVTINGEHIAQTLYFDNGPGHLGHQNYYLLYHRSGTGTLVSSGTILMYERVNGRYTTIVNSSSPDTNDTNMVCGPTSTQTTTAAATATSTPVPPTPASTIVPPTDTPTSTATVVTEGSATPLADTPTATPTNISTDETVTPLVTETATSDNTSTATATSVATSSTSTPVSTNTSISTNTSASTSTSVATGNIATPGPQSTPTLVSLVHASTFPERPVEHQSPASPSERALPATGQGARTRGAIIAGLLGTALAAIGLGVCAMGLRTRRTK
jgi:hypothetical protein